MVNETRWSGAACVCLLAFGATARSNDSQPASSAIQFERDIVPIVSKYCLSCHSASESEGGLDLSRRSSWIKGGDSGAALVPGDPSASYFLDRIHADEMPPVEGGKRIAVPKNEIAKLTAWVQQGAIWPEGRVLDLYERTTDVRAGFDWWSLQPVRAVRPPAGPFAGSVANPVDAFIRADLHETGMTPAPPADRRTLIKRVYFDLIGLPPTAEEIEAFVRDSSPDAYALLVDRMLASPHYGERWARYWLDLVRFAETNGYERDAAKPHAWKYRDWVIQAFNEDKPYDRFVTEQLAGDELPDRSEQTLIGTGFLRVGTWDDEPNDPLEYKYERIEDLVHATSSSFLALTVKCARCHDHKFDPIPQVDYHRLAAAFWAGPIAPGKRELHGGLEESAIGHPVLAWTDLGPTAPPMHLLAKGDAHRPRQVVEAGALSSIRSLDRPFAPPPAGSKTTTRRLQLARWIVDPKNPLTARVMVNRLWLHHFGAALVRSPNNFGFAGEKPTHPELLDWLAEQFIQGGWRMKPLHRLMLTSATYQMASIHPRQEEYADQDFDNRRWWRANRRRLDAEALRDGMLAVSGSIDLRLGGPGFVPRLSAEATEGLSKKQSAWSASAEKEQNRRSIYIFSQRSLLAPMLTTFDFCDTTQPCGQRDVTIVAPQALALLNNEFVHQQSQRTALRILARPDLDRVGQVELAWRMILGRSPRPEEQELAAKHLAMQQRHFADRIAADGSLTLAEFAERNRSTASHSALLQEQAAMTSLCHVLINSNEFVFCD